jgi:hypothetical protein
MKKLESQLYPENASADISEAADNDFELFEIEMASQRPSSSLSAHSGPIVTSPRVNAYLSRRGDGTLLRERLAELQSEQTRLERDIQTIQEELVQTEEDIRRMYEALPDKDDPISAVDDIEGEEPYNHSFYGDSPPFLDISTRSESNFLDVHDPAPLNLEQASQKTRVPRKVRSVPHFSRRTSW